MLKKEIVEEIIVKEINRQIEDPDSELCGDVEFSAWKIMDYLDVPALAAALVRDLNARS
jgi:hypothetical protein